MLTSVVPRPLASVRCLLSAQHLRGTHNHLLPPRGCEIHHYIMALNVSQCLQTRLYYLSLDEGGFKLKTSEQFSRLTWHIQQEEETLTVWALCQTIIFI